ncbi:MAG: FAD-dependent oxidoreductase, partial [Lachnospiraceae bacterium]|nr:FAD-dependent oxidoreductase [Candidatus Minthocola equi]
SNHNFFNPVGDEVRPSPYDYCEIPYRCLVPEIIDNMLTAGRCISATNLASSATRVIASCMTTGQAAGTAAAMAIDEGVLPVDIDGKAVRADLIKQGVTLDQIPYDIPEKKDDEELFVSFLDSLKIRKKQ